MRPKFYLTVIFLMGLNSISFSIFAQSEQQIKSELEKRGINTYEEVQAELRKRGMTEADARRQARLYGVNYDDYLKKYILKNSKDSSSLKPVTTLQLDTIDYTTEIQNRRDTIVLKETLNRDTSALPYFGYDIFNSNPNSNQQGLVGNIDPGYVIGPGDELRVYLWGEAEFQFEGEVDINGNLFIPNVGQVFVSGTSYENLNIRLKQYLSRFYSGLTKSPPAIFLDISLTKLRPIRIMVMGESKNPGSLLINSFATTLNAIYASGGIKTSGSLREIKVFRNNKFVSTIDLYDYLIKGAVSEDIRLVSNDVLFIQSRMNSISVQGEINREGIYELRGNEGLVDLIGFAGGLKPSAYTQTITIKRIKPLIGRPNNSAFDREIITVDYNELLSEGINFQLQDGDEIIFDKVLEKYDNLVTISGSVFRPGEYQMSEGMSMSDLISTAGGLRPNTYFEKIDLFRRDRTGVLKFQSFSLSDVMAGNGNSKLQPDDSLKVYNIDELKSLDTVSIEGFLSEPKTILWRENLSLYDLIFMSANVEDLEYKNRTLTSRADLLRYQEGKTEYQVIPFNLDNVLDRKFNAVLRPKDRVILYSRDINEVLDQYVTIRGGIKNEGRFALTDSMTVEDLILQAGGFVRTAFKDSVTITRENFDFTGNLIAKVNRIPLDMNYLLGQSSNSNSQYYLKHNDNISIDLIPGSSESREVILTGEIKFPGNYFLRSKEETLKEVIVRAGGISPNAYLPGAKFYRNGQQLALAIDDLWNKQNESFNITLQPNDSIYFPEAFYTVKVEGEVNNPSLQKYQPQKNVREYVRNAGGKTKNGKKIFVTSANGFTKRIGWFQNPKVLDGAIITVSAKPPKEPREPGKFLENFGTIATIVSSTLTTVFLVQSLRN